MRLWRIREKSRSWTRYWSGSKGPGVLRIGVAFSNLGLITLTSTASQISQIWSITGRFNNGTGVTRL